MNRRRNNKGLFCKEEFNKYIIKDNVALIEIYGKNGEIIAETLIDIEDIEKVINLCRWNMCNQGKNKYVFGRIKENDKTKTVKLHRVIMDVNNKLLIDHIDHNGLNNQKSNLRIATNSQNQQNTIVSKNNKLGYKGISICTTTGKFLCQLKVNNKLVLFQRFDDLDMARKVYNYTCWKYHTHLPYNFNYVFNAMGIIENSYVNGPGNRMVIWNQGCNKHCPGCFNPEGFNFKPNKLYWPEELAEYIIDKNPEGLTFSGGDPFEQPESLLQLLYLLHNNNGELIGLPKGIICFTGYDKNELDSKDILKQCMNYIDLTIAGRYVKSLRIYDKLAGSSNKQFIFLNKEGRGEDKISIEEVEIDQEIEVHEGENNTFQITGFPDINNEILSKLGIKVIG